MSDLSQKQAAVDMPQKSFENRAGPLKIAGYIEPFALLVAQLAYEGKGRPELAYRFERFGK